MGNKNYRVGYARVSTEDQRVDLQVDALDKAGCHQIYSEVASTKRSMPNRPKLDECLRSLRPGDTLVVWRLDRLGRDVTELCQIVNGLAARDVAFESLTEHIDTSNAGGRLIFHMFSAFAEFERNILRERTRAGLVAARARGRKGGRRPKVNDKMRREMKALYDAQDVHVSDICVRYGIGRTTFYRVVLDRNYRERKVGKEANAKN
jgi:DNA invertase Pin-like site-specific DNA recombinase